MRIIRSAEGIMARARGRAGICSGTKEKAHRDHAPHLTGVGSMVCWLKFVAARFPRGGLAWKIPLAYPQNPTIMADQPKEPWLNHYGAGDRRWPFAPRFPRSREVYPARASSTRPWPPTSGRTFRPAPNKTCTSCRPILLRLQVLSLTATTRQRQQSPKNRRIQRAGRPLCRR